MEGDFCSTSLHKPSHYLREGDKNYQGQPDPNSLKMIDYTSLPFCYDLI